MSSIFNFQRQKPKIQPPESSTPSIFQHKKPGIEEVDELASSKEQVQYPFEGENDLDREIERNQARNISRMTERTLGLPGDVVSMIQGLTGKKTEEFPLPTSQKIKETSERLTRGYTKPQTPFEEKTDEYMEDVASMMLPGGGGYSITRNIGIPLVGNLAKEGIKYKGGDEKESACTKMGSMVLLDLLFNRGKGGVRGHIGKKFQAAEAAIPQGAVANARALESALSNLETSLHRGG